MGSVQSWRLPLLPGLGRIRGVQVRYSPRYVHYVLDEKLLTEQPTHPLRAYMESWLDNIPHGTLRWCVNTRPSVNQLKKSVQRSALQSKWYKVFCQALEEQGYDRSGKEAGTDTPGLVGTMELTIFGGSGFDNDEPSLRNQCGSIIQEIRKQQSWGRPAAGRSGTGTSEVSSGFGGRPFRKYLL